MSSRKRRDRTQRREAVRLADIAAEAGVSTATVSRALNEPHKVSDALRDRVFAAIERNNWVPHAAGKALASARHKSVGVLMPGGIGDEVMGRELRALQRRLNDSGYAVQLAFSELDEALELTQARLLLERGVDALVLHGVAHHDDLWRLLDVRQTPVVLARTYAAHDGYPTVGYDAHAAFRALTEHLLELGHRRIGMMVLTTPENERAGVDGPHARSQTAYEAVRETLQEVGLAMRAEHVTFSYFGIERGCDALARIMAAEPRPTALVCMNDSLAIGALVGARRLGIDVPDRLSIVGFDDVEWAAYTIPPLTTMRAPDEEIGRATAERVLASIDDAQGSTTRIELPFKFRRRGSTARAPRET